MVLESPARIQCAGNESRNIRSFVIVMFLCHIKSEFANHLVCKKSGLDIC